MTKTFGGAARLFLWHTNKAKFLKRALETRELHRYINSKRKKSRSTVRVHMYYVVHTFGKMRSFIHSEHVTISGIFGSFMTYYVNKKSSRLSSRYNYNLQYICTYLFFYMM